jgi:predicted permease
VRILFEDLRLGARRLWQQPGFSVVAVLMLALGLGANTTMFTLVHSLLMQRLPVDRPDELYRLGNNNNCCVNSGLQTEFSLYSYPLYLHLRDNIPEFSSLAGFQATTSRLGFRRDGDAVPDSFPGQLVSGNYFRTFGVRPAAGRLFVESDDRRDAPPVVVMSHQVWTERYGGDPAVVGATYFVQGQPMSVIGVAPEGFFGDTLRPDPTAFWIPLGQEPMLRGAASILDRGSQHFLYAIGRAKPGATPATIQSRATGLLQQWLSGQSFMGPENKAAIADQRIIVVSARGGVEQMRNDYAQSLNLLFGTSALVLLITAANLANLLLARADRGQAALRAALGASRARLVHQALIEGVILSVAGGLMSLVVGAAATRALLALAFPGAVVPVDGSPSLAVIGFALGLAVVTGIVFTAAPAWAMSRTAPIEALHGVGRSAVSRSFVPRRSLVIVQVALSMVLLASAGLLAGSLSRLEHQPLGFDPERRLVVRIEPPALADQPDRLAAFYQTLQERLQRTSGVERVSYALYSPMEGNNWSSILNIEGRPAADPTRPIVSSWNRVGPGYFDTVGTRLIRGRAIDERDTPAGARVAVVNATFVRQFFEKENPIGRRVGVIGGASHAGDYEIVGVVEDVKYTNANRPTRPMVFFPAMQLVNYEDASDRNVQARSTLLRAIVIQTAPGATGLEASIRRTLAAIDPNMAVLRFNTMGEQVGFSFRLQRLMSRLTVAYGGVALVLAAIGLYGVTAYAVARRSREIGVRMALGADRMDIMRTMLRGPLLQTLIGLAIGFPLALLAGRALATQLYEIGQADPAVLGGAALILLLSAGVAAVLPARRAASLDPTRALRE